MKIVVCVNANEKGLKALDSLANYLGLHPFPNAELHFVHVFETQLYAIDLYAAAYPLPEQYPQIDEAIVGLIKNKVIGLQQRATLSQDIKYVSLHGISAKETLLDYLNKEKAELVVVNTRGHTGLKGVFSSSFADYMIRHAPCPVLTTRTPTT